MTHVLDASAVLATFRGAPGGEAARARILAATPLIGAVDSRGRDKDRGAWRHGGTGRRGVRGPRIEGPPPDLPQAAEAGRLRRVTTARGLSLGDRACLAPALAAERPVLTGGQAWEGLHVPLAVEVLR